MPRQRMTATVQRRSVTTTRYSAIVPEGVYFTTDAELLEFLATDPSVDAEEVTSTTAYVIVGVGRAQIDTTAP